MRHWRHSLLMVLICVATLSGFLIDTDMAMSSTTYFVDSAAGLNANAGTAPETAWRDFTNINGKTLSAGDKLLIKRGSVINQELQVSATGTADNWAEIGTYGTGARPHIRRNWDINDRCVLVRDPDYLRISGLVVSCAGKGLVVTYTKPGHVGLLIEDCIAYHIEGLYRPNSSGIPEWRDQPGPQGDGFESSGGIAVTGTAGRDITIRDCEMFHTSWGFFVLGDNVTLDRIYCHHCYAHNTCPHPAAIRLRKSVMQNCVLDASGGHAFAGTMGIMLVDTNDFTIRNCTFRNVPDSGSHDEGGIDFESRGDRCLIDACTFENNAGAAIEVLGLSSPQPKNVEIRNSRFIKNNWANKLGPGEIYIWGKAQPQDPKVCCSNGVIANNGYVLLPGVQFFVNEAPTLTQWSLQDNVQYATVEELDKAMPHNNPPVVDAGADLHSDQATVQLTGVAHDDDRPAAGSLKTRWEVLEGPAAVSFEDETSPTTKATFASAGSYLLRLVGDDGQLWTSDMVAVHVLPPDVSVAKAWEFNRQLDKEGWTEVDLGTREREEKDARWPCKSLPVMYVSGGYYIFAVENSPSAHVLSADQLNVDVSAHKTIKIRFQNHTPATRMRLSFTTAADTSWDEGKSQSFDVVANDNGPREYAVDMSTVPLWTGMLKQLRLDLAPDGAAVTGTCRIDYLWIDNSGPARPADESNISTSLKHVIVGPDLPMTEVQWYCDERVPAMPAVETVAQWEQEAQRIRTAVLDRIVYRGEAAGWRDAETKVEWLETIDGGPGYRIRKLRYEALPGLWIPAVLYEPENLTGKVPAILNVNGHTPLGKQYPPKQLRCINYAKRGMLALNIDWVGMGQLIGPGFEHYHMNQLDLCGTSGLAPFYLNMKRGLDVLLSLEHADPTRVAMTGLSGGGWQTIFLSALDTRVTLTNPVAGYSSFKTRAYHLKDLGDSEQTPNDLATICDYTHLTAMMAPRPTLLTFNLHDSCCFEGAYALEPLLNAVQPIFRLYDKEQALRSHVNNDPPDSHNYDVDNRQQNYRMLGDFFYPGDEKFNATEIPSDAEVKELEPLLVAIPEDNLDFNKLALALCKSLPRDAALPTDAAGAAAWQQSRVASLREIVRAKDLEVSATEVGREEQGGVTAIFWQLRMNNVWTVPAIEFVQGQPQRTAIVVADDGRQSTAAKVTALLGAGYRVIAADPFYLGESKIAQRDFLFALLLAAVGDRPIGLQASQVAALARWSATQRSTGPVTLVATGPRSTTMALIAAGLEQQAIGGVTLHGSLGSLKEVIEQNWGVDQKPELFCFGLLESFDIKQLAALIAPRGVTIVEPSERAKTELADLAAWYQLWQTNFDPLAARQN